MAASGLEEFLGILNHGLNAAGAFAPQPYYNADADAIFFYARDTQSYAKRLNSFVTLFLSCDDDSLVGVKLKSIRRIIALLERLRQKDSEFKLTVVDRKIKLGILIELALLVPAESEELAVYEEQLEEYDDVEIEQPELVGA